MLSDSESHGLTFLSGSLKSTALRGYDLSKPLRPEADETDNPAEIVKLG